MSIGRKIRAYRKKLGLSQGDLAKHLGVTQRCIAAYECGERRPKYEKLAAMAKLFDVSVDHLLEIDNSNSFQKIDGGIPDLQLIIEGLEEIEEAVHSLKKMVKQYQKQKGGVSP